MLAVEVRNLQDSSKACYSRFSPRRPTILVDSNLDALAVQLVRGVDMARLLTVSTALLGASILAFPQVISATAGSATVLGGVPATVGAREDTLGASSAGTAIVVGIALVVLTAVVGVFAARLTTAVLIGTLLAFVNVEANLVHLVVTTSSAVDLEWIVTLDPVTRAAALLLILERTVVIAAEPIRVTAWATGSGSGATTILGRRNGNSGRKANNSKFHFFKNLQRI